MNQILLNNTTNYKEFSKDIKINKMKYIFFISVFIIIFFIFFYVFLRYNAIKNNKISQNLKSKFEIKNLYSASDNYSAQKLSTYANLDYHEPFVIGLIKIEKINLVYPILSSISDDSLKIAPCRFYGPMANSIGNMCVAGHNFANQTHFAKLHQLNIGDIIEICDLNGNMVKYFVYSKDETDASDLSCLSQDTNLQKEITLVTCNTIKGTRVIVKAKETTI